MTEPFNPIPVPEHLSLGFDSAAAAAHQPGPEPAGANPGQSTRKKAGRPNQPKPARTFEEMETKGQRIKARLAAKIAAIDREKLRQVLLACGIAATVVTAVVLMVKLMPVITTILALLGLGLALQLWDRMRYFPRPF